MSAAQAFRTELPCRKDAHLPVPTCPPSSPSLEGAAGYSTVENRWTTMFEGLPEHTGRRPYRRSANRSISPRSLKARTLGPSDPGHVLRPEQVFGQFVVLST